MGTSTPTEQAPAYDDLFEAPANANTSGLPFLGKHSKVRSTLSFNPYTQNCIAIRENENYT